MINLKGIKELKVAQAEEIREMDKRHHEEEKALFEAQQEVMNEAVKEVFERITTDAVESQTAWIKKNKLDVVANITQDDLKLRDLYASVGDSIFDIATRTAKKRMKDLMNVPMSYDSSIEFYRRFVVALNNTNSHNYPIGEPIWLTEDGVQEFAGLYVFEGKVVPGNRLKKRPFNTRPATPEEVLKFFADITAYSQAINKLDDKFNVMRELEEIEDEKEEDLSP